MPHRYIISDLHLGHGNIIGYCSRPFDGVREMNNEIVSRWNETVSEDDQVILLGDVELDEVRSTASWIEELNGNIMLIRGNHDGGVGQNFPAHVVESCELFHGRFRFYCEHQPLDMGGWQLHGHVHNNDVTTYPFVDPYEQRVNVSSELLDYTPLLMDELIYILERGERFRDIEDARDNLQGEIYD